MDIVGYADRFSVEPGQTIKFMVSSKSPTFRASLVRLLHGDPNPSRAGRSDAAHTQLGGRGIPRR